MRTLLTLLPALACGAMMLVCARMMLGHKLDTPDASSEQEVEAPREEVALLRSGGVDESESERSGG